MRKLLSVLFAVVLVITMVASASAYVTSDQTTFRVMAGDPDQTSTPSWLLADPAWRSWGYAYFNAPNKVLTGTWYGDGMHLGFSSYWRAIANRVVDDTVDTYDKFETVTGTAAASGTNNVILSVVESNWSQVGGYMDLYMGQYSPNHTGTHTFRFYDTGGTLKDTFHRYPKQYENYNTLNHNVTVDDGYAKVSMNYRGEVFSFLDYGVNGMMSEEGFDMNWAHKRYVAPLVQWDWYGFESTIRIINLDDHGATFWAQNRDGVSELMWISAGDKVILDAGTWFDTVGSYSGPLVFGAVLGEDIDFVVSIEIKTGADRALYWASPADMGIDELSFPMMCSNNNYGWSCGLVVAQWDEGLGGNDCPGGTIKYYDKNGTQKGTNVSFLAIDDQDYIVAQPSWTNWDGSARVFGQSSDCQLHGVVTQYKANTPGDQYSIYEEWLMRAGSYHTMWPDTK